MSSDTIDATAPWEQQELFQETKRTLNFFADMPEDDGFAPGCLDGMIHNQDSLIDFERAQEKVFVNEPSWISHSIL